MELMLDTANLNEIREGITYLPVSGITTNPTIIRKQHPADFFGHLKQIKGICGTGCGLHVQVVSTTCDGMLKDAFRIFRELGDQTYVKIPVTEEGLKAIKTLSSEGKNVTATAVYSSAQGILAMLDGAKYIAVYYNRMANIGVDPDRVIGELAGIIGSSHCSCHILAASFRNIGQVVSAYSHGAQSCTVGYNILKSSASLVSVLDAVDTFAADWKSVYGNRTIAELD